MVTDQLRGTHPHLLTVAVQWDLEIPVRSHPHLNPEQAGQATVTRGLEEAARREAGTRMRLMPRT